MTPATIHANALVIGEVGLLVTGPSGAGKSALALALIGAAQASGAFARLVADDRVRLAVAGQRLIARPHPLIAGKIEARGLGLLPVEHLPATVIGGVIALEKTPERLPEAAKTRFEHRGVVLPQLTLRADADLPEKVHLVHQWLKLAASPVWNAYNFLF